MKEQPLKIIVTLARGELNPINAANANRVRTAVARLARSRPVPAAAKLSKLEMACERLITPPLARPIDWRAAHEREVWAEVVLELCEKIKSTRPH